MSNDETYLNAGILFELWITMAQYQKAIMNCIKMSN